MISSKTLLAAALVSLCPLLISGQPSQAGWVLQPSLCPDLIEDRLDRREDRIDRRHRYGGPDRREDRRDRRENRRDEAVTHCPPAAFVHIPGTGDCLCVLSHKSASIMPPTASFIGEQATVSQSM